MKRNISPRARVGALFKRDRTASPTPQRLKESRLQTAPTNPARFEKLFTTESLIPIRPLRPRIPFHLVK